jgi:endonuclease/exonuclease/phosphatase family metal-dependent hydrolase
VRLLLVAALLVHCLSTVKAQVSTVQSDPSALRVMSFNIRNSAARDGANDWAHRKERVVATIREFHPDLVGAQEVLADQYDDLAHTLGEYILAGVARDDGARKGEWALILFRKERFESIDAGNFWLSDRPEEVGSKSWDAANIRICSWVKLRDKVAQKAIVFANTHFDHKGVIARRESATLLRRRLATLAKKDPLILAGDFNCTESDPPYRVLTESEPLEANGFALIDSYRETYPERTQNEATFHAFKGGFAGARIDWILHSPQFKAVAARIIHNAIPPFSSDHYPVVAVLAYRGQTPGTE